MEHDSSENCGVCGVESSSTSLTFVKLSGFSYKLKVCESCFSKKPEDHYKEAASILSEIIIIATESSSEKERILKIKELLGD